MKSNDPNKTQRNLDPDRTIGPGEVSRSESDGPPDSVQQDPSDPAQPTLGPGDSLSAKAGSGPVTGSGHEETLFAAESGNRPSSSPARKRPRDIEGYEVLEELGRGGMGVVYKARDKALNRIVALKMILAGAHASEDAVARFKIETEAVAQLHHRGIVQVYDVGHTDGQPWCALEFIDGGGLDELMTREDISLAEAVAIVEELAHAMSSAHQAGIVHRDLKPANVLISRASGSSSTSTDVENLGQYRPRITDFGLARKVEQESQQTQTGAIMGTPGYMAPEQARGAKRIGPAADIYSLGAILFHLVTGKPPFTGETPIKTIMQVLHVPAPSPRSQNPSVDRDLDTIILKCLEKEPAARYASAEHLAQDLHRYQNGMPIDARPVSGMERLAKWIRRKPWAAAMMALSSLGIIGVLIGGAIFNSRLAAANRLIDSERQVAVQALAETSRALQAESAALEAESAARQKADDTLQRAENSEAESRRRLIDNYVNNALQAMTGNQMLDAIPWLAEAIALEEDPGRQAVHQLRFNMAVQAAPKPERTWLPDAAVVGCAISRNGKQVASVTSDRRIRIYDIASHQPIREMESPGQVTGFDISTDQRQAIVVSLQVNVAAGDFSTRHYEVQLWDIWEDTHSPPLRISSENTLSLQKQCCAEKGWFVQLNTESGELELIDLQNLQTTQTWPLSSPGAQVHLDGDGKYLAVLDDQQLTVWDLTQPASPWWQIVVDDPQDRDVAFDFEPDGRLVWVSDKIRVVDLPTRDTIIEFPRENSSLPRVAVGPGECGFALAWPNGRLETYDFAGTPVNHTNIASQIVRLFYSSDQRFLFVATNQEVIRLDARFGVPLGSPIPATLKPLQLADYHAPSETLAIASGAGNFLGTGCLRLWNIQSEGYKLPLVHDQETAAPNVDWLLPRPDGRQVAVISQQRHQLTVMDIQNRRRTRSVFSYPATVASRNSSAAPTQLEPGKFQSLAWSQDGRQLAMAFENDRVALVHFPGGEILEGCQLTSPDRMVFSEDGTRLAVAHGENGNQIAVIDTQTGGILSQLTDHRRGMLGMKFSLNGEQLATVCEDFNYRLMDVASGQRLEKKNLKMLPLTADFDAAGQRVAVGGERLGELPGRLSILDAATGEPVMEPLDFESSIHRVRFSGDGKLVAVADVNGTVRVIDVPSGRDLGGQMGHPDQVQEMHFSQDNRLLLTVCLDRRTRLMDVTSFMPVTAPSRMPSDLDTGIRSAHFLGPTYDMIEQSQVARIWEMPQREFSVKQGTTLSRFLTGSVISPQGTLVTTPSQALREDFSNVTFGQILDNDLFQHLLPR